MSTSPPSSSHPETNSGGDYSKLPELSRVSPPPEYGSWTPPPDSANPRLTTGDSNASSGSSRTSAYEHDLGVPMHHRVGVQPVHVVAPNASAYDAYDAYQRKPGAAPLVASPSSTTTTATTTTYNPPRPATPPYESAASLLSQAPQMSRSPARPTPSAAEPVIRPKKSKRSSLLLKKDRFPDLSLMENSSIDSSLSSAVSTSSAPLQRSLPTEHAVIMYSEEDEHLESPEAVDLSALTRAERVVALAAGREHTLAFTVSGSVWAWGSNVSGETGVADAELGVLSEPHRVTLPDALSEGEVFVGGQAGDAHSILITSRGRLFAVGYGADGRLGIGSNKRVRVLTHVPLDTAVVQMAVAGGSALAVTAQGTVYAWGDNRYNQLGLGPEASRVVRTPHVVHPLFTTPIKEVALGRSHSMFLSTTGTVFVAGKGYAGQLGLGDVNDADVPSALPESAFGNIPVTAIAAGDAHSVALTHSGEVYVWGSGSGLPGHMNSAVPFAYHLEGPAVYGVSASFGRTVLQTPTQTLVGLDSRADAPTALLANSQSVILDVALGEQHLAVLTAVHVGLSSTTGTPSSSSSSSFSHLSSSVTESVEGPLLPPLTWAGGEEDGAGVSASTRIDNRPLLDIRGAFGVLVDTRTDQALVADVESALRLIHSGSASVSLSRGSTSHGLIGSIIKRLALFVSDRFGGGWTRDLASLVHQEQDLHKSGAPDAPPILLGNSVYGGARERSLLFKVLGDLLGIPVALEGSKDGERTWNVVELGAGKRVVVDTSVLPAELYPEASTEAESYVSGASAQVLSRARARALSFTSSSDRSSSLSSSSLPPLGSPSASDDLFAFDESLVLERTVIGRGGFGVVEKGSWAGTVVAIKSVAAGVLDDVVRREFEAEVRVLASVKHPNVVQFLGASRTRAILVTEYCANGSLWDVLRNDSVSLGWDHRIHFACGAAAGLLYLHCHADPPIVHRDLKSLNLLLTSDWCVKVADFGLARIKARHEVLSGRRLGSYQWMAPELYAAGPYTEAVDVYAFGIVMWELATRRIPFEGLPMDQVIDTVIAGGRPVLLPGVDLVPIEWVSLMASCWAPDPIDRPRFPQIWESLSLIREDLK